MFNLNNVLFDLVAVFNSNLNNDVKKRRFECTHQISQRLRLEGRRRGRLRGGVGSNVEEAELGARRGRFWSRDRLRRVAAAGAVVIVVVLLKPGPRIEARLKSIELVVEADA